MAEGDCIMESPISKWIDFYRDEQCIAFRAKYDISTRLLWCFFLSQDEIDFSTLRILHFILIFLLLMIILIIILMIPRGTFLRLRNFRPQAVGRNSETSVDTIPKLIVFTVMAKDVVAQMFWPHRKIGGTDLKCWVHFSWNGLDMNLCFGCRSIWWPEGDTG